MSNNIALYFHLICVIIIIVFINYISLLLLLLLLLLSMKTMYNAEHFDKNLSKLLFILFIYISS